MLLVKDKKQELYLIANYIVQYHPYKIEGFKIINDLDVPQNMRFTKKSNIKEIILEQHEKIIIMKENIKKKKEIIKYLESLLKLN